MRSEESGTGEKKISFLRRHGVTLTLSVLMLSALVWGGLQYRNYTDMKQQVRGMYTRSFYELVGNVDNMEVWLSKMLVSTSPANNIDIMDNISRQADAAASNLSSLPITHPALATTMRFVNQVGDLSRVLSKRAGDAVPLGVEDVERFQTLHNICADLSKELHQIQNEGTIVFEPSLSREYVKDQAENPIVDMMNQREKGGIEYPTLIYDGPFSDGLEQRDPKGMDGSEVDEAGAKQAAASFLGRLDTTDLSVTQNVEGRFPGYMLTATTSDNSTMELMVARKGGKVLWMMAGTPSIQPTLTRDECVAKATEQLSKAGFSSLVPTWMQEYDGVLVISFAVDQNGVILYPDLVKAKVRMDNGLLCGYDGTGYYLNHETRTLPEPVVSLEEARLSVSSQIQIQREKLTLIPLDGGSEALCWEFMGNFGGDTFLVYIDAISGKEQQIFKVINTDTGSLVVFVDDFDGIINKAFG